MNKSKETIKEINGKNYKGSLCKQCKVWIPNENWEGDTHKRCKQYLELLPIRERVFKKIKKGRF